MNRRVKSLLLAFIVISIAGLAALVFIHYNRAERVVRITENIPKAGVRIEKIHYSGTKEGRIEWELDADSARRSREEDLTVLDGVKVTFYPKKGPSYTLKAREAALKESAGEIKATGGVIIESADGYRAEGPSFDFSMKSKVITSSGKAELKSRDLSVSGKGLKVDIEKGLLSFSGEVRAVLDGTGSRL